MSIRTKIIIPMITVAVVCIISLGLLCVLSINSFVGEFNDSQLSESHNLAAELLEQHREESVLASSLVAEDDRLIETLVDYQAGGDRQPLVDVSVALMTAVGVDFVTVMDTEGNVLVRAHEPDNFGDSLAKQANVQNAMQGKQYMTIEKGTAVKLSVRCGTPIYDANQKLIGVVSLGYRLDQSGFVDYIKRMTNTEVTVFLGDTRVSTTVLNDRGERAIDTKASETVSQKVLGGQDYVGFATVLDKKLYAYYSPIKDTEGTVLGMLFVGLDTSATTEHRARNITLLLFESVLFIVLSTLGAMLISGRIARPIREISGAAKQLASGDVNVKLKDDGNAESKDEVVQLRQAFMEMVRANCERAELISTVASGDLSGYVELHSDKDVVGLALTELLNKNNLAFWQMSNAAAQLDVASNQIADGAQNLSHGANEQAVTIERLHSELKKLSDRTIENSGQAKQAATLSESIKGLAEKGSGQMDHMMEAVDQISKASEAIEKVMKVIDDIAFQTNILALNAAVEAARAGQHGKGFAVVAEEVRNLAAKSADAAKDTGTLIANSIEKARLGAQISSDTAASFADIVDGINKSSVIVNEIAEFMQAQNIELKAVTKGVDEVGAVVNSVSSAAEQSAASSEEMSSQATAMAVTLGEYKLRTVQPELPSGNDRLSMPPSYYSR